MGPAGRGEQGWPSRDRGLAPRARSAYGRLFPEFCKHEENRSWLSVWLWSSPGATLDQYDQVIEKMGFSPGGAGAPGGLFHWVAQTDDGIRVTDVWESRDQFEQFAKEQIGPYTAEVGIPNPPQISFLEVHNYLTAG